MGKNEMLAALAMMPEADEKWMEVEKVVRGNLVGKDRDEKMMTLADVSRVVGVDRTWMYRLGVRQACGKQVAGRLRYKLSDVTNWLASSECATMAKRLSQVRREQRMQQNSEAA